MRSRLSLCERIGPAKFFTEKGSSGKRQVGGSFSRPRNGLDEHIFTGTPKKTFLEILDREEWDSYRERPNPEEGMESGEVT